jgi:1-acyl-sn-glycerol-3-phosphate acyltransferase
MPGAMFLFLTRILLLTLDGIFLSLFSLIMTLDHDFSKGPLPLGLRRTVLFFVYDKCVRFYLVVCGLTTSARKVDVDYSEYLGPNY